MRRLVLSIVLLSTAFARAQESLDDIDQGKPMTGPAPGDTSPSTLPSAAPPPTKGASKATAEVNGYFDNRTSFTWIDPSAPIPTKDTPALQEILEANLQLRVDLGDKRFFAYSDLSLFYQGGWLFYKEDGMGGRADVANHDVPSLRPFFVPSEVYLSLSPRPWLNILVGKKRIIWSSGFAFNPTDLVNPPKDPTDPNFQRSGNWVARVEAPFEKWTLTALFAPQALYTTSGIPYQFLSYPSYAPYESLNYGTPDPRDKTDVYHYLVAGRLYMLLYDTDINLIYYFSNQYQDGFSNKSRIGFSASRYFFTDYELHVEALLQQGSGRMFPDHDCANMMGTCNFSQILSASRLNDGNIYPRVVVGTRRQFSDETLVSIEYYYQGDGDSPQEFNDSVKLLLLAKSLGVNTMAQGAPTTSGALPQKYTFDPLRRHYLIASYSKPRIFDDWTVSATLIAGLSDLSGLFSASVSWTPREWMALTLYGYAPIRSLGAGENINGQNYTEYSLLPFDFKALFEARFFY